MSVSIFFLLYAVLNIVNCCVLLANDVSGLPYWISVIGLNGAYICGNLRQLFREVQDE